MAIVEADARPQTPFDKDVVANDCELVKRRGGRPKSHTENDDQNR